MEDSKNLKAFFERYAAANNNNDLNSIAGFYAESFIAAAPQGNGAFKNDDSFIRWLEQVEQFNRQTGMRHLQVVNIKEMPISTGYTQATVTWGAKFEKTGDELITFDISYFLYLTGGPKIIMYISHEDQEVVMRQKGLL
ncbi:hypothetical protein HF324_04070 [Chitinophaga oryzae]|uniref:Nuclear transport factor 2 family protein n=1 Tax=Chitinophaga oryzae TaxID=2725414 RepID=A0AAE6ZDC7_9BACT|nr:hypothetical protein [Chitinophaga oryzae]QJB30574.1 hypothetical protein HF329_04370 [Chitinophaga oryzae]QJB37073.1 hypothetical protein HF324_04070 [Chitinophaga oryzae]